MLELFPMWALVEVLGLCCLPLTFMVFHNLPDRGWAFSKALAMATLAFAVWFPLVCLHALPFSRLFIAGVFVILLAISGFGFLRLQQEIVKFVRLNVFYIAFTEVLFLAMVLLLGWLRSFGPDIRNFEMFMDEGFVAAIMRSPHLPPNDMWFAGQSINYYYYAHYTIAMLAKLLGQSPSIAFNTGICIFFGLTATNLFGVTCNIVSWARYLRRGKRVSSTEEPAFPAIALPPLRAAIPYGLLCILMGLVMGNLAATRQWWMSHGSPDLFGSWFGPSRVINNTINEFPAFSFVLSCFHAHVLTLAFTILAIGLAFNLFLEPVGKGFYVFGRGARLPLTLGVTALVIGGLFTMNGWDFPTYIGLAIICIALQQWLAYDARFRPALVLDIFVAAGGLLTLSLFLYLPFYLNFVSPSQGIALVLPAYRSQLSDELLIYGLFAFVFLSFLLTSALKRPLFERPWGSAARGGPGSKGEQQGYNVSGESAHPHVSGPAVGGEQPGYSTATVVVATVPQPVVRPVARWLLAAATAYLLLCLVILKGVPNSTTFVAGSSLAVLGTMLLIYNLRHRAQSFALLLGALAFALVAVCEIVFLKDVFAGKPLSPPTSLFGFYDGTAQRMNTVFKFYFQAWALLSIASSVGVFFILEAFREARPTTSTMLWLRRFVLSFWSLFSLVLVAASMVYPLTAPFARFAHIDASSRRPYVKNAYTLDGLSYLANCRPPDCVYDASGDYQAIRWLNENVQGAPVIVEAVGDDYSGYGRISTFTGLPTLIGWIGHEYQWRVNWLNDPTHLNDYDRRAADVEQIYTNRDSSVVLSLLMRYHAQYLYVGPLEINKYPKADLHRYSAFMGVVYNANGVTIYQVK